MALMLTLDDAMKVLIRGGYIDEGYIDDDGNAEYVKSELEQKCYYFTEDTGRCLMDMAECIGLVTDPNMICEHIIEGDLTKWLERIRDAMNGNLAVLKDKVKQE